MIPKHIQYHQFWDIPEYSVAETVAEYTAIMPDYEHRVYTELDPEFIADFGNLFSPDTMDAPYMADVVRYWYLWKYGGFYVDLDTRPVRRFDPLLTNDVSFVGGMQMKNIVIPYFAFAGAVMNDAFWLDCLHECRKLSEQGAANLSISNMHGLIHKRKIMLLPGSITDEPPGYVKPESYIIHYRQSLNGRALPMSTIPSNFILTRGGKLISPRKGKPPTAPEGYAPTTDPFVFDPILRDCKYANKVASTASCCRGKIVTKCAHPLRKGALVNLGVCKRCQDKYADPDDCTTL